MAAQQDRDKGLFTAVVSVAAGLELGATLRRIVQAAVELVDASYGALGVLDSEGGLGEFIHVGIDAHTAGKIGHLPEGRGILGLLMAHPVPIRLAHLSTHPWKTRSPPAPEPSTSAVPGPPNVAPFTSSIARPLFVFSRQSFSPTPLLPFAPQTR